VTLLVEAKKRLLNNAFIFNNYIISLIIKIKTFEASSEGKQCGILCKVKVSPCSTNFCELGIDRYSMHQSLFCFSLHFVLSPAPSDALSYSPRSISRCLFSIFNF